MEYEIIDFNDCIRIRCQGCLQKTKDLNHSLQRLFDVALTLVEQS